MFENSPAIDPLRQALRMYLFVGVVLVAVGVRSWRPAPDATRFGHAAWVVSEVIFWPKVFPDIAARRGVMFPRFP
jgi:hypothetical protein